MKDYAAFQGNQNVGGSRDATREALQLLLISERNVWMDMIQSRNKTSHTYNEETANEIYGKIINEYFPVFWISKLEWRKSEVVGNKTSSNEFRFANKSIWFD